MIQGRIDDARRTHLSWQITEQDRTVKETEIKWRIWETQGWLPHISFRFKGLSNSKFLNGDSYRYFLSIPEQTKSTINRFKNKTNSSLFVVEVQSDIQLSSWLQVHGRHQCAKRRWEKVKDNEAFSWWHLRQMIEHLRSFEFFSDTNPPGVGVQISTCHINL